MGIDYERFAGAARCSPDVQKEVAKIRKRVQANKTILSIDRLDYTRGIPQRLEAFDLFLEKYPEFKGRSDVHLSGGPFTYESKALHGAEKAGR